MQRDELPLLRRLRVEAEACSGKQELAHLALDPEQAGPGLHPFQQRRLGCGGGDVGELRTLLFFSVGRQAACQVILCTVSSWMWWRRCGRVAKTLVFLVLVAKLSSSRPASEQLLQACGAGVSARRGRGRACGAGVNSKGLCRGACAVRLASPPPPQGSVLQRKRCESKIKVIVAAVASIHLFPV